ncbi:MAG: glycosyltransferase [Prevotellaceae bacterium]|jgi:glycosyltransferase involved in cell wall biosynthesis|nr:glycosyltransferase [Prevotellaceae bacterium]
MTPQPQISIIIPIYNDELYLSDLLQSVENQTFTDFECLCINDGSTDRTEQIIDKFAAKDSRFFKINRTNGGVSAARNTGLDVAKGEYVFFIDHDDLIPAYSLEKLYNAAQKYNADLSRGKFIMISENCAFENLQKNSIKNSKSTFYKNPLTDYYKKVRGQYKRWYYIWQCLFKRSAIEEVRFLEELRAGGEDFLFTFDTVAKIKNFVQIDDIAACHRQSKISTTLNGYKPDFFFNICEIVVPYIYRKYAENRQIDKRLRWWVYHKEAYAVYRFLVRNMFRRTCSNADKKRASEILNKINNTPEFQELIKYLNFRQKFFLKLFLKEKFALAQKLKIFI